MWQVGTLSQLLPGSLHLNTFSLLLAADTPVHQMTHCVSFPPCAISPFLHKLQLNPLTRMIVVRFNPQVLNSCGLWFHFLWSCFPICSGIWEPHFPPPRPLSPPPLCRRSLAHEFRKHQDFVYRCCGQSVVCSRGFGDLQLHVQPPTCSRTAAHIDPKGHVGVKKARPGWFVLSVAFFFFLLSLSHPRTSFMATSVFTGLTAALLLWELRQ